MICDESRKYLYNFPEAGDLACMFFCCRIYICSKNRYWSLGHSLLGCSSRRNWPLFIGYDSLNESLSSFLELLEKKLMYEYN